MLINNNNFEKYLDQTYGKIRNRPLMAVVGGVPALLQNDYGDPYDCSITSITAILSKGKNPKDVYNKVESVAKKYFYNGKTVGTNPLTIKAIINQAGNVRSHSAYGKGIGFNWEKIKNLINANRPIVLSMLNDGRKYYVNHSVTVIGYQQFNQGKIKMLAVYDNWHKEICYVDYNKLSRISSINYI